jgi:signal transduction histidine kinase
MIKPQIPINEEERLQSLDSFKIVDTLPETDYDNITFLASTICNTPISLVSLIDEKRQFFKSRHGLITSETERELAFCAHAINTPLDLFQVDDARLDMRFMDNPLVVGQPHVIFYAGMPLVADNGQALGTLCVIDNKPNHLTDKQTEALKALSEQVIHLLELRRKNIKHLQFQRELETFAHEMETFAYAASHDLREPLRMVKSYLTLFEKKYGSSFDEKAKEYIHFAVDGANRMDSLIKDLLAYSLAGKADENCNDIDINNVVDEIKQLNKLVIAEKEAVIETKNLPIIHISHAAIRQILQNLISNALKYQAIGVKPVVVISFLQTATHWQFMVKDNGIGIPAANLDNVFTLFKRLHTKEKYSGTGIGLAICKKIVLQHDGNIWVESEEGKGSTFYFTIKKQ